VKAFAEFGVPLRWDRDTLYDMHFVTHAPDRSLFEGIYQVPPGSYLVTDGDQVRITQYWDWDYPLKGDVAAPKDPREHIERFAHEFEEAVKLRLRADVPVACYLSGGIDSCTVLGVASKLSSRPLRAYTLSFDHSDYDEGAIAEEQAKLSGAEFQRIDIRSEHMADHFSDALYHAERPFANSHVVAKYLLSRAVRDSGIKVVLTGEGSDEILAGYPHFRRDAVMYGSDSVDADTKATLLSQLEAANRVSSGLLMPQPGTRIESVRQSLGYVPSQLETWAQIGAGLLTMANDDFTNAYAERDTYRLLMSYMDVERQLAGRDVVNQSLYVWAKTMLPNYILGNLGDRMEMAHSVEGRLPFLDHHVVEAVAQMPVSMKINGMTEKWVLREAVRGDVTDEVYRRQKHPFISPPATLNPDDRLHEMVHDTLRGSGLARLPFVDRAKVTRLLDGLDALDPGEQVAIDQILMMLLSGCVLGERFGLAG
jgi:asparagine synthase (glutamine-hydrolysing)